MRQKGCVRDRDRRNVGRDGGKDGQADRGRNGQTDGQMDGRTEGRIDGWMDRRTDGWRKDRGTDGRWDGVSEGRQRQRKEQEAVRKATAGPMSQWCLAFKHMGGVQLTSSKTDE